MLDNNLNAILDRELKIGTTFNDVLKEGYNLQYLIHNLFDKELFINVLIHEFWHIIDTKLLSRNYDYWSRSEKKQLEFRKLIEEINKAFSIKEAFSRMISPKQIKPSLDLKIKLTNLINLYFSSMIFNEFLISSLMEGRAKFFQKISDYEIIDSKSLLSLLEQYYGSAAIEARLLNELPNGSVPALNLFLETYGVGLVTVTIMYLASLYDDNFSKKFINWLNKPGVIKMFILAEKSFDVLKDQRRKHPGLAIAMDEYKQKINWEEPLIGLKKGLVANIENIRLECLESFNKQLKSYDLKIDDFMRLLKEYSYGKIKLAELQQDLWNLVCNEKSNYEQALNKLIEKYLKQSKQNN